MRRVIASTLAVLVAVTVTVGLYTAAWRAWSIGAGHRVAAHVGGSPLDPAGTGTASAISSYPWPVPAGEDRACPPPMIVEADLRTVEAPPGHGRRIVVIGDSLTRETRRGRPGQTSAQLVTQLRQQGWEPLIVCFGGKDTSWGMEQIRLLQERNLLGPRVIVALGTNDLLLGHLPAAEFETRVRTILGELARGRAADEPRRVWWVNVWAETEAARQLHMLNADYDDMSGFRSYNDVLSHACVPSLDCTIIDWAAAMDGVEQRHKLAGILDAEQKGGIHLTQDGSLLRARLIANSISNS